MFPLIIGLAAVIGLREMGLSALEERGIANNDKPTTDGSNAGKLFKDSVGGSLTVAFRKAFSANKDKKGNIQSAPELSGSFLSETETNAARNERNSNRFNDLAYRNLCRAAEYGTTAAVGLALLPFGPVAAIAGTLLAGTATTLFGTPVGSSLKASIAMKFREEASSESLIAVTNNPFYQQITQELKSNSLYWTGNDSDPLSFIKKATIQDITAALNPTSATTGKAQAFFASLADSARSSGLPLISDVGAGSLDGISGGFSKIG